MAIHDKAHVELIHRYPHEYNCWRAMRNRCSNPRNGSWRYYGARGIRVCGRWDVSFRLFMADMGPAPSPTHTLDRLDDDGHYEPGNVRWATKRVQQGRRSYCRMLTVGGLTLCLAAWARRSGIPPSTIASRIDDQGWTAEEAVSVPVQTRFRSGIARRHR